MGLEPLQESARAGLHRICDLRRHDSTLDCKGRVSGGSQTYVQAGKAPNPSLSEQRRRQEAAL